MRFDPIGLIESAYRPCGDAESWLRANAPAIVAPFDADGFGTCSYVIRDYVPEAFDWQPADGNPISREEAIAAFTTGLVHATADQLQRLAMVTQQPGAHSFVETFGGMIEPAVEQVGRTVGDSPAVIIPTGVGVVGVVTTLTSRLVTLSPEQRILWQHVSVHLGAACRLSMRPAPDDDPDVEAVIDSAGRVVHAAGRATSCQARARIGEAARQVEQARSREGRADPLPALRSWPGLFAGRWSLVEHEDTDGRRYLVAKANAPDVREPAVLTRRQRQVVFYASMGWSLSQIAYALGLAEGTITHHLGVALRKIGVGSRAELIRIAAARMADATVPRRSADALHELLTASERAVAEAVIEGLTNEQIASSRGVSLRTVANQLTSVYRKLGVRGRHELVHWASNRRP